MFLCHIRHTRVGETHGLHCDTAGRTGGGEEEEGRRRGGREGGREEREGGRRGREGGEGGREGGKEGGGGEGGREGGREEGGRREGGREEGGREEGGRREGGREGDECTEQFISNKLVLSFLTTLVADFSQAIHLSNTFTHTASWLAEVTLTTASRHLTNLGVGRAGREGRGGGGGRTTPPPRRPR